MHPKYKVQGHYWFTFIETFGEHHVAAVRLVYQSCFTTHSNVLELLRYYALLCVVTQLRSYYALECLVT